MINRLSQAEKEKRLSQAEKEKIKKKVKGIYESIDFPLNFDKTKETAFPISKILEKENIKLMDFDIGNDDVSGAILIDNGNTQILVNSKDKRTRRRFTVAHELGHYYLHREQFQQDEAFIDYRDGSKNKRELEADYFAGYLLAPTEKIEEIYCVLKKIYSEISDRITWLSERFNVSRNAMYVRLSQEGIL